jgi:hypothetical protein
MSQKEHWVSLLAFLLACSLCLLTCKSLTLLAKVCQHFFSRHRRTSFLIFQKPLLPPSYIQLFHVHPNYPLNSKLLLRRQRRGRPTNMDGSISDDFYWLSRNSTRSFVRSFVRSLPPFVLPIIPCSTFSPSLFLEISFFSSLQRIDQFLVRLASLATH